MTDALEAAFLATRYRVRLGNGRRADIRIGAPLPPSLLATLATPDAAWAFVTAWNPLSQTQPATVNRARQHQLLSALRQHFPHAHIRVGVGVGPPVNPWREMSLFVQPVEWNALDRLMQPFRQWAIVRGTGPEPAQLHWYVRP
ncbi:MAG TPA: DUF3293 domain-containing protein [Rhodanobacteraceae bacterium]